MRIDRLCLRLALLLVSACGEAPPGDSDLSGVDIDSSVPDLATVTPDFAVPTLGSGKVDLLIVIDNAVFSLPRQNELRARIGDLFQTFTAAAQAGHPVSYHIGVITSDLGAGQFTLGGGQCHPGGDGARLQAVGSAAAAGCVAPTGGMNFIDLNQPAGVDNLPAGQDLVTTFGCMSSVGANGCGFQMPLEAAYRALHDPISANNGFLRPDALLTVLWVTHHDDCSVPDTTDLFDPSKSAQYGALTHYRCYNYGIECGSPPMLLPYGDSGGPLAMCASATAGVGGKLNDLSKYITYFSQPASSGGVKADPNQVLVASLAAPPMPVASVLVTVGAQGQYTSCPTISATCTVELQRSCVAPSNSAFFGDPAVRLDQVMKTVGRRLEASICDVSYQATMQTLGQEILSTVNFGG